MSSTLAEWLREWEKGLAGGEASKAGATVSVLAWNFTVKDPYSGGAAPIHVAAGMGLARVLVLALAARPGAASMRDCGGLTPLMTAAKMGRAEAVAILAALSEVDARSDTGATALHYAASFGHVDCMRALLAGGADPLALTDMRGTILHSACRGRKQKCIELAIELCDGGARDVNGVDAIEAYRLASGRMGDPVAQGKVEQLMAHFEARMIAMGTRGAAELGSKPGPRL